MKRQFEVRRDRLRVLVESEQVRGKQRALAERLGMEPSYISNLLVGRKNMGETIARKIEQAMGLPVYWMDLEESGFGGLTANDTHLVPVLGEARLQSGGEFERSNDQGKDQWIRYLRSEPDNYALRCVGDAMQPRLRHDELLVVAPSQQWQASDMVLVERPGERGLIGYFGGQRGDTFQLLALNQDFKPISVPMSSDRIHVIVGIAMAHSLFSAR